MTGTNTTTNTDPNTDPSVQCTHPDFSVEVGVARIKESDDGPVTSFMTHIRIKCKKCQIPFQFLGMEVGVDLRGATIDVDGQEARLAIVPVGSVPHPLNIPEVLGYRIKPMQPKDS